MTNEQQPTFVIEQYRLIRSPWNNLGDPRFARYFGGGSALGEAPTIFVNENQMSTCSVLKETLAASTDLGTFNGEAVRTYAMNNL